MSTIKNLLYVITIFILIFVVHEIGHAYIGELDTNHGWNGIEFTGHGITEPGFNIYIMHDSIFITLAGLIFSAIFIMGCILLNKIPRQFHIYCIIYTFWLARWDMLELIHMI